MNGAASTPPMSAKARHRRRNLAIASVLTRFVLVAHVPFGHVPRDSRFGG